MRAKVRFPIGPMRAKVCWKRGQSKPSKGRARRLGPHYSNSAFNRRLDARCASARICRIRRLLGAQVWCGVVRAARFDRPDRWSKGRPNRRFELRVSRWIGPHSRSNGSGPRVESHGALGSNRTGPSGRIARGPRVESHLVNRRCNRRIPLGPRVESHSALASSPTGSTGD